MFLFDLLLVDLFLVMLEQSLSVLSERLAQLLHLKCCFSHFRYVKGVVLSDLVDFLLIKSSLLLKVLV